MVVRARVACSENVTRGVRKGVTAYIPYWNVPAVAAVTPDEKARINMIMSYENVVRPHMRVEGAKSDRDDEVFKVPCMTNSRVINAGEVLRQGAKRESMELHEEDEKMSKKLKLASPASSSAPKSQAKAATGTVAAGSGTAVKCAELKEKGDPMQHDSGGTFSLHA